jgi:hypothetical protein
MFFSSPDNPGALIPAHQLDHQAGWQAANPSHERPSRRFSDLRADLWAHQGVVGALGVRKRSTDCNRRWEDRPSLRGNHSRVAGVSSPREPADKHQLKTDPVCGSDRPALHFRPEGLKGAITSIRLLSSSSVPSRPVLMSILYLLLRRVLCVVPLLGETASDLEKSSCVTSLAEAACSKLRGTPVRCMVDPAVSPAGGG